VVPIPAHDLRIDGDREEIPVRRHPITALSMLAITFNASAQTPAEESASPFALEEVVVTGTAYEGRTKFESSVAISTFNAEEIAQQAPTSTADLISAVPGFWVESTAGTTQGNVFARGIIQDGGYRYVGLMEDGIPIYPVFELSFYNPDQFVRLDNMVDRVEAVRGGTAPIFTSGAVGGTINMVTRKPGDTPSGTATVTFSDYGLYRGDVAWSAPLASGWGVALGGYYRKSDGIRDPGYTADEGGQFRVNVAGEVGGVAVEVFGKYLNDRSLFMVPIPLSGDASDPSALGGADPGDYSLHSRDLARAGLPASAAELGLQGSDLKDGIHPELFTIGARVALDITPTLSLTNLLRYTDGDVRFDGLFTGDAPVTGLAFAATRGVAPVFQVIRTGAAYSAAELVQNHGHWVVDKEFDAIQDDARLNLSLAGHELTFGVYFADYGMTDRWSLGNLLLMDVNDRPSRLSLPGVTDSEGFTRYSTFNLFADYDATAYAFYVADEWQLTDALRIDVGVRYDDQEIDATVSTGIPDVDLDGNPATTYDIASLAGPGRTELSPNFNHTNYSIGFNYEFTPEHAVFGHYTDAAKLPHFDDVRNGVLTKDEVTNIEVGYKAALAQLGVFVTLFQTEFDNVPFNDILADGSTIKRSAKTRTRGVELEGVYQPMDALDVRFSITQQEPEYEEFSGSALDNSGNRIRRIPKTMIRLTPAFTFLEDRARVFATYTHVGKRFSNDENTIALPKYDTFDAGVSYQLLDAIRLQLTAENLTDEAGLTEGNPRTDLGATGVGALYMARPLLGRSYLLAVGVDF
jgi:iron complex outermembrane recepter protein